MSEYGIPYLGSKAAICDWLISKFPPAENFYDLFGGGFAVTHALLLKRNKDFRNFYFNEIRTGMTHLIRKAIAGEFSYDRHLPEFVSRENFFKKKDTDPSIKILWSFGNDGSTYLFSKEIEPYKKSMHDAIVFNKFDKLAEQVFGCKKFADGYSIPQRRLFLRAKIRHYRLHGIPEFLLLFIKSEQLQQLQQLRQLQQLQQLERLQQLQQLEQLEQLEFSEISYDKVPIKEDSIVYCDPPYAGTAEYDGVFDSKTFYEWAGDQDVPVFVSEYQINSNGLYLIGQKTKISRRLENASSHKRVAIEKLYVNESGKKAFFSYIRNRAR